MNAQHVNTAEARSLLDQLLTESRLYRQSKDYKALLDFVVRLRNFAPFNAMLLQVQKPGLTYAASAHDWWTRFGRKPTEDARPLLILWPFGPVALVYDVQDTEGDPLPEDVHSFFARGAITDSEMRRFMPLLERKHIGCSFIDYGDQRAGSIRMNGRIKLEDKDVKTYLLKINKNHCVAVQFATLTHELGHLFLGHLGSDNTLGVPKRVSLDHDGRELEAESVSFLVCARNGVKSKAETYLTDFVSKNTTVDHLDLYHVMRAAGQLESLLQLTSHTSYAPVKE